MITPQSGFHRDRPLAQTRGFCKVLSEFAMVGWGLGALGALSPCFGAFV